MPSKSANPNELCIGCVYFPPNLPQQMYTSADWDMLQDLSCSFEHHPGDEGCQISRKTSCSLVDLTSFNESIATAKV